MFSPSFRKLRGRGPWMRGLQAWSCSIGYRPGWAQRTGCEPRRALQAAIPAYLVAPPLFCGNALPCKYGFLGLGGTDPVIGQLKRKNGCLFQQEAVSLAENAARFAARPVRGFRSSSCQNADKDSEKRKPPGVTEKGNRQQQRRLPEPADAL